jgi:hypothetical protein
VIKLYYYETICLPTSDDEWNSIATGLQSICGFPNVVGAIDGSLIEIERPRMHDGWYCRKSFPAFNIMALVDHNKRFRAVSIMAGSNNDKAVFNTSLLSNIITNIIPENSHILGDAGYKLTKEMLIPFDIAPNMPMDEALYNYLHSRTRIVVEMAFGLYKVNFRSLNHLLISKAKNQWLIVFYRR